MKALSNEMMGGSNNDVSIEKATSEVRQKHDDQHYFMRQSTHTPAKSSINGAKSKEIRNATGWR